MDGVAWKLCKRRYARSSIGQRDDPFLSLRRFVKEPLAYELASRRFEGFDATQPASVTQDKRYSESAQQRARARARERERERERSRFSLLFSTWRVCTSNNARQLTVCALTGRVLVNSLRKVLERVLKNTSFKSIAGNSLARLLMLFRRYRRESSSIRAQDGNPSAWKRADASHCVKAGQECGMVQEAAPCIERQAMMVAHR